MAENSPSPSPASSEPEFRAYRKRMLTGCCILCIIAVPVGFALKLPHVWGLAIAGIIVAALKLSNMDKQARK